MVLNNVANKIQMGEKNMTEKKPVFLISHAIILEPKGPESHYDSNLNLNVLSKDGITPVVASGENAPTHSKTEAYPGDDDPDPDQDRCY